MKKTFKSLLFVFMAMVMIIVAGCSGTVQFELKAVDGVTSLEPGESVQLYVNNSGIIKYEVLVGDASVNADGLLTCSESAMPGSTIVVSASCDAGTAKLTFNVKQKTATSIELLADSETIKVGQTVNLSVNFLPANAKTESISYEIITGSEFAEVNNGKVTIKENADYAAIIGQKVTIKAMTAVSKLTDDLTLTVVNSEIESIFLSASETTLVYGSTLKLNVSYVPSYAGLNASYALSIAQGSEFVELDGDVLKIKEGALEEEINGQTVIVKATLEGNEEITSELEITLSEREKIYIVSSDKTIIAGENASELLIPEAYDKDFNLLDLSVSDFTYESSNEDVVKVGLNDGKLTPVGHGQAEITISYQNSSTVCEVYVIVVPEAIELTNLSVNTLTTRKYYYSIHESLLFDIELTENKNFKTTNSKLAYKFELLDEEGNVVETTDELATVTDGLIDFNVTGDIKVTITTDSSLNDKDTAKYEKSTSIVVNVNDGLNIRSVADLITYSGTSYIGKAANFINEVKLTETENFGYDSAKRYNGLHLKGDRYFYGNGYAINLLDLPLSTSQVRSNDLLYFYINGQSNTHTVEIHDLTLIGNYDLDRLYIGNIEASKGKDSFNGSFHRAIAIGGNLNTQYGVCENLVVSNLTVSNFNVGLRIDHTVNSYVTDINISQCASNGIELNQNLITLNNIYVGQVGAFAIEMVPDDVEKDANGNIHGTAGYTFDQTPDTKLTGSITSINYNNGKSTSYMASLQMNGFTIPDVLIMIVSEKIKYASNVAAQQTGMTVEQCQAYFADLTYRCLFKNGDPDQKLLNFFLLIFVNPTDDAFAGYNKGNDENVFGTYSSDEVDGNMITIDKILEDALYTLIAGGSYDAYKNYKYILADLDVTTAMGFHLGEVVLVNEAYNK